jgi:hypothetical protein
MFTGIGVTTEAMFRREDSHYIEFVFDENVQQMLVAHHTSVVREDGNSLAFQDREVLGCLFSTHHYLTLLCMAQKDTA